jgi:glycosyltransferase involved in cell wall biosynthesis
MSGRKRLMGDLPEAPPGRTGWPWTEETDPAVYEGRTDWPRISIVTPSFNQARFLEETIRSVLLQNYPNLQYVLIDGGSTDGSVEIIKKYAPWLDYWVSEKDRGQSHAINKGLEHCDGEWFNWLNSDDYLMPGALSGMAVAGASSREAIVTVGGLRERGLDNGEKDAPAFATEEGLVESLVNHRLRQPAMFYRRAVIDRLDENLHLAMDFALWARVIASKGMQVVARTPQPVAVFRHHQASKTSSQADGFDREERQVHAGLVAALGWSSNWVSCLSGTPWMVRDDPRSLRNVEKLYAVALVRRYLAGDLRNLVLNKGFWTAGPLFAVVARVSPMTALRTTLSSLCRRWFGKSALFKPSHA